MSQAVLVKGIAVEDPRLAPDAIELARWFDRRISTGMILWGILTVFLVVAGLALHSTFLWVMAGGGIVGSCVDGDPQATVQTCHANEHASPRFIACPATRLR